jgi:hypothetical protein
VPVPENQLFAPPINIKVKDDRLIHQPLVATRSISMTPFIPWTPEEPIVREDVTPVVDKIPGAKEEPVKPSASGKRSRFVKLIFVQWLCQRFLYNLTMKMMKS